MTLLFLQEHGEKSGGAVATGLAVWQEAGPLVITAAAISVIVVETGGYIVVLSRRWLRDLEGKASRKARREEAKKWERWVERNKEQLKNVEPPPSRQSDETRE